MVFFKTIYDIGFKRLFKRIKYELRRILDKYINYKVALKIYGCDSKEINWNLTYSLSCKLKIIKSKNIIEGEIIKFNFIGISRNLIWPIKWNQKNWERLWQFNLHYFDWIKKDIDFFLKNDKFPKNLLRTEIFIDHWIKNNNPGRGDGWHSYTLSLRIRNWIWFFIFFPKTLKQKRINSLWQQICWLYNHPESCHGGNHWLENLITLSLATLHFKNKKAEKIFMISMERLKKELKMQILADGGHEERSAGYHFLILERLIELGCFLKIAKKENFDWLDKTIEKMVSWAENVKLLNEQLPRFNDSSTDMVSSPNQIIEFGISYLNKKISRKLKSNSLKYVFIDTYLKYHRIENDASTIIIKQNIESITDLLDTGWTILRPGKGWEITYKWGTPCPKHLPAHVQSDLCSFDIFYNGLPIIAEAGTSTYEYGSLRLFQRSSQAHNIFQLGKINKRNKWIEPVEVWDNFRAGFKAKPLEHYSRIYENNTLMVGSSHDGYLRYGANYSRQLFCLINEKGYLKITIVDNVNNKKNMCWRKFLHFSPKFSLSKCKALANQIYQKNTLNFHWSKSGYSNGFGNLINRNTLCVKGLIKPGNHIFKNEIIFKL
tara:strand:+ start:24977 stop:26785 length:1809 start_codon:yes stop_codon:yes gene_type:complete